MSIPTPFNPLGTLGRLVDFKQTYMTDGYPDTKDAWEEEPSVRWSTEHMTYTDHYYGWKAFNRLVTSSDAWLIGSFYQTPLEAGYIEFAKELYLLEIEVANYTGSYTRQYGEIEFYNYETGDIFGSIVFPTQGVAETKSLKNINKWVTKLGIRIVKSEGYGFGISAINFKAKHEK